MRTLLEHINGPLCEYLGNNIQLPQNVKDYIYTKLGTKRYQLIDLGDNVKWRTVKMENALILVEGEVFFGFRAGIGPAAKLMEFIKTRPNEGGYLTHELAPDRGYLTNFRGTGQKILKVYAVIGDEALPITSKKSTDFNHLLRKLSKSKMSWGVNSLKNVGIEADINLVKFITWNGDYPLTSSHLNMAASRLITEAKQVYGKFLRLMDDIHRVESKVSKHGLLFYQYLLALKEITHERVQKSYYL